MANRSLQALLAQTTCPHCWHKFEPQDALWIAAHPTLRGDPRLGSDAPTRFLPSRFSPRGLALDEKACECTQLACPQCHLHLPRLFLDLEPWFVSILGSPGCGKSFFLAAMSWALRQRLPASFHVSFTDTDAEANQFLVGYEQSLFHSSRPDVLRPLGELIEKTKEQGDLYNTAVFGDSAVQYPRPMLFTLRPEASHPLGADPAAVARILCLYDNAGESFLAGRDSSLRPVTRHVAESSLLLFLFDPTQHPPFRQRLGATGLDAPSDHAPGPGSIRQDMVLTEAAARVRRFAGRSEREKHDRPLIVVVTKYDLWNSLVPGLKSPDRAIAVSEQGTSALNLDRVEEQSRSIRGLLAALAPEVVSAAEGFAESVTYVGASSLGVAPTRSSSSDRWSVRPGDLRPIGVEVPLLLGLNEYFPRLIPAGRRAAR